MSWFSKIIKNLSQQNISKIKIEESLSQLMIIKMLRTAVLMTACGADTILLTCILRRLLYSSSPQLPSPVLFSTRVTSFTMPPTHLTKHLILYDDIWFCCGLNTSTPPCKGAMEGFLLVVLSVFISSDRYMRRWYKLVKSFYVLQWKSKQDIRVKYVIYFCCEIFFSS